MKNKQLFMTILMVVIIALQVVAISTNDWSIASYNSASAVAMKLKANWGLWKECSGGVIGKVSGGSCSHLPPQGSSPFPKNSLEAARAFAVLGPCLVAIAMLGSYVYPMKQKNICMLLLAGAISSIIAMVIWSAELLKLKSGLPSPAPSTIAGSPGYSFYLNLSAGVLGLIGAYVCYNM